MEECNVAVVGAGASGCALAAELVRLGAGVSCVLIDKSDRICKKLSATGNGQGNISNAALGREHYFGSLSSLAGDIASEYSPESFFSVKTVTDGEGRVYPLSRQASSLGDMFLRILTRGGVKMKLGAGVSSLSKKSGGFCLELSSGERLFAQKVALCTGGAAGKQYGTDGTAYELAKMLGHTITETRPSLVQLKTDTENIRGLKGVRADVVLSAYEGNTRLTSKRGDVIFTDYGLSGNAAFFVSAYVSGRENVFLSLDFAPDFSEAEMREYFEKKEAEGYKKETALCGLVHNSVGRRMAARAEREDVPLFELIKDYSLRCRGTLGFDTAQVTKGGIPASEITGSLESALCPGLFFAGEILDVDGECGGYNLHFAFSSGIHAAKAILRVKDGDIEND
ncbi:MAG: aminoacetone oxidase family FAD-binding enzyme [Clostridia bacterium]|nr:aminoacetone oxidase family FAD-binding enzyme [Clostridia bacterium]